MGNESIRSVHIPPWYNPDEHMISDGRIISRNPNEDIFYNEPYIEGRGSLVTTLPNRCNKRIPIMMGYSFILSTILSVIIIYYVYL